MQFEKNENKKPSLIKSVIEESKKIRAARGEDFFAEKKQLETAFASSQKIKQVSAQIHASVENKITNENYESIRNSHTKLVNLIADSEKKNFEKNTQVLVAKKTRSKSIHLYLDEKIEHFLKAESEKSETKWGLRKNAGLGNLIQKFILNFIELKKREERQLKRVKKVISEFQIQIVEFKKYSGVESAKAEEANQKMKVLSNDLNILLSLLEFEDGSLQLCLGNEQHSWVDLILKWKHQS